MWLPFGLMLQDCACRSLEVRTRKEKIGSNMPLILLWMILWRTAMITSTPMMSGGSTASVDWKAIPEAHYDVGRPSVA